MSKRKTRRVRFELPDVVLDVEPILARLLDIAVVTETTTHKNPRVTVRVHHRAAFDPPS